MKFSADKSHHAADTPRLHWHQQIEESGRIALAAAATIAVLTLSPPSALAKPGALDLPACTNLSPASSGLSFCDTRVGSGEAATAGDLVEIDYTARATATGQVYDGSRKFKFTLGNDEILKGWELSILGDGSALPAMREGGIRTALVPPELAFGKDGGFCMFGLAKNCRIPPDSPVEITTAFKGSAY